MNQQEMTPKPVSASAVNDYFLLVFPHHLNPLNTIFGGAVLLETDIVAAHVALAHTGTICVTLGMDAVRFLETAKQGDTLIYKASVNRVWGSSMEVGVKVVNRNMKTGDEKHVFSAYCTFVAKDENGNKIKAPQVIPETEEQKRRYEEADARREQRLANVKK